VARERSNPHKRALMLISRGGVGWWWPGILQPPKNERNGSFSEGVGGGGGQREAQPPKTSMTACFWCVWMVVVARGGLWVVVVARGRSNARKRAVVLIFGVVLAREGPALENEHSCSFSRGVGGDDGQRKVQP
jgi:hypothetical protein